MAIMKSLGHVDQADREALYALRAKAISFLNDLAAFRQTAPAALDDTLVWDHGAADDIVSDLTGLIQNIDNVSLT